METVNSNVADQKNEVTKANENISAHFQTTSKTITEELSLKEIVKIFTGNWLLFLIISSLTVASTIGIYIFRIPYVSTSTVVVNDAQNSALQSFASQFFGLTKSVADGKKNNSPLQKHLEYLKTEEFYNQLLTDLNKNGSSVALTIAEKMAIRFLKMNFKFLKNQV